MSAFFATASVGFHHVVRHTYLNFRVSMVRSCVQILRRIMGLFLFIYFFFFFSKYTVPWRNISNQALNIISCILCGIDFLILFLYELQLVLLSRLLLAWHDIGIQFSIRLSVCLSICQHLSHPNFDLNVQVHFPKTIKATVMILGISLHLGMTAVFIFDLDLYFMVHQLCKFVSTSLPHRRNIAFSGILVL